MRRGRCQPGYDEQTPYADPFSRNQLLDDVAVHIGEAEIAAGMAKSQFGVVEAQQPQQGRVEIMDVDRFSTALKPNSSVAP